MKKQHGFSLIEVTLSIGIMAFTMIPLVSLLGTGLQAGRAAEEQNESGRLATQLAQAMLAARKEGSEWEATPPLADVIWEAEGKIVAGPLYFDRDLTRVGLAGEGRYAVYLNSEGVAAGELRKVAMVVVWPPTAEVRWEDGRAVVEKKTGHLQNLTHWTEK